MSELLAESIKKLRYHILENPNHLTGQAQPAIETLWAYCTALTDSIDIILERPSNSWVAFLQSKNLGMHTELSYIKTKISDYQAKLDY